MKGAGGNMFYSLVGRVYVNEDLIVASRSQLRVPGGHQRSGNMVAIFTPETGRGDWTRIQR